MQELRQTTKKKLLGGRGNNMNKSNKRKVRTMYEIGVEISEIARIFKITPNEVLNICKGVKRK
jgi:DNA invertase Pin-like site-specific DNA recombinase